MRANRYGQKCVIAAVALGGLLHAADLSAGVKYTWINSAGGNWGTSTNWSVAAGQLAYPKNKDTYAMFTIQASGSQTTTINVADAEAYFLLFDLGASNTIASSNGTNALNLVAFSTAANDLGYGVGVTAIQVKGT